MLFRWREINRAALPAMQIELLARLLILFAVLSATARHALRRPDSDYFAAFIRRSAVRVFRCATP